MDLESQEQKLFKLIYSDGAQTPFTDTLTGAQDYARQQEGRDPGLLLCMVDPKLGGVLIDFRK